MAIVKYQCDTCKRVIEVIRNIHGIDTVGRCTVTLGCRGHLNQSEVHQDFTRASIPPDVEGLDNWQQRRVLYNHDQVIERASWTISHNLGTFPAISIFVDKPTTENPFNREEILASDIEIVNPDTTILHFDRAYSGIAQLVARSSDPQLLQPGNSSEASTTNVPFQISNNSKIAIACRVDKFGADPKFNLVLEFVTSAGATFLFSYSTSLALSNTAWSDANRIVHKGKVYAVREFAPLTSEMTVGTVNNGSHFRIKLVDVDTDAYTDYVIDEADRTWLPNALYLANQVVINGSNSYLCVVGGTSSNVGTGPSGTGASIVDGNVLWKFFGSLNGSPEAPDIPKMIAPNDVIILLANAPYQFVDKIFNKAIDFSSVTKTKNPQSLFFNDLEFYSQPSIIQTVYPPIRLA